jgi:hypothetical protein
MNSPRWPRWLLLATVRAVIVITACCLELSMPQLLKLGVKVPLAILLHDALK